MIGNSDPIDVGKPLVFNTDEAYIDPSDTPPGYRKFLINVLKVLDLEIDRQWEKLDRFEFLSDKAAGIREDIAEIRSDPQGDGLTRAERHDIHELRDDLSRTLHRIDVMPDYDVMVDRLMRLETEFIHKSDAWDLSL